MANNTCRFVLLSGRSSVGTPVYHSVFVFGGGGDGGEPPDDRPVKLPHR